MRTRIDLDDPRFAVHRGQNDEIHLNLWESPAFGKILVTAKFPVGEAGLLRQSLSIAMFGPVGEPAQVIHKVLESTAEMDISPYEVGLDIIQALADAGYKLTKMEEREKDVDSNDH